MPHNRKPATPHSQSHNSLNSGFNVITTQLACKQTDASRIRINDSPPHPLPNRTSRMTQTYYLSISHRFSSPSHPTAAGAIAYSSPTAIRNTIQTIDPQSNTFDVASIPSNRDWTVGHPDCNNWRSQRQKNLHTPTDLFTFA